MADNISSDAAPKKQPVWVYIAKNKEEADRVYGFGFDAGCRAELRPELIAALRGADVVLLGRDPATEDKLASIVRQLRVLDPPDLTDCNKEQFVHLIAERLTPEEAQSTSAEDISFLPPDVTPLDEQPAPREPEAELPATEMGAEPAP